MLGVPGNQTVGPFLRRSARGCNLDRAGPRVTGRVASWCPQPRLPRVSTPDQTPDQRSVRDHTETLRESSTTPRLPPGLSSGLGTDHAVGACCAWSGTVEVVRRLSSMLAVCRRVLPGKLVSCTSGGFRSDRMVGAPDPVLFLVHGRYRDVGSAGLRPVPSRCDHCFCRGGVFSWLHHRATWQSLAWPLTCCQPNRVRTHSLWPDGGGCGVGLLAAGVGATHGVLWGVDAKGSCAGNAASQQGAVVVA